MHKLHLHHIHTLGRNERKHVFIYFCESSKKEKWLHQDSSFHVTDKEGKQTYVQMNKSYLTFRIVKKATSQQT